MLRLGGFEVHCVAVDQAIRLLEQRPPLRGERHPSAGKHE
jgi:hypothetical protein